MKPQNIYRLNHYFLILFLILGIFLNVACNEQAPKQDGNEVKTDNSVTTNEQITPDEINGQNQAKKTQENKESEIKNRKIPEAGRYYNDVARLLAGLPQEAGSPLDSFQRSAAWKRYSQSISSNWGSLSQRQLEPMKNWAETELKEVRQNTSNVFYPFSGPDIMNAFTFFPHAERYVLIGLEPIGSVPTLNNTPVDSMNDYFALLNKSFYAIFNFSFFRTNSMAVDLKNKEIDGTLPLMLVFLARTGNRILDVHYVQLTDSGEAKLMAPALKGAKPKGAKGVEITFESNGQQKYAYYFSTNLSDDYFKKNTALINFVKNLEAPVTYLKSASYLLHKIYFSVARSLILDQSKYVLQDDSGIPLNYFGSNKWDVQLYGVYTKPIEMFSKLQQEDMKQAYKGENVKPLPFGIGYNWRLNQSNLQLAKRR